MTGTWRPNTLFRSSDVNLANGMRSLTANGSTATCSAAHLWARTRPLRGSHLPRRPARRGDADPDGGISVPVAGTRFGVDAVRQLHVGHPVGRAGPMDDELLRDRVVRGQRRDLERRSEHRPLQPVVDRQPELPAVGLRAAGRRLRLHLWHAERTARRRVCVPRPREGHPGPDQVRVLQQGHARRVVRSWSHARGVVQEQPRGGHAGLRSGRRGLRGRQSRQPGQRDVGSVQQVAQEIRCALRRPVQQHRDAHIRHARRARGRRRRC